MSDRGSFFSGFLLGTVLGGVVGGVAGVVATAYLTKREEEGEPLFGTTEEEMELARRGVEDKIAQLNHAIDDVRQQLGKMPRRASAPEQVAAHDLES